jgi:minor histocompatibility antigen H13
MSLNRNRNSKVYFYANTIAYTTGLVTCLVVSRVFQHPQPGLLYLVPSCIGPPLLIALLKGDLQRMFAYKSVTAQAVDE